MSIWAVFKDYYINIDELCAVEQIYDMQQEPYPSKNFVRVSILKFSFRQSSHCMYILGTMEEWKETISETMWKVK